MACSKCVKSRMIQYRNLMLDRVFKCQESPTANLVLSPDKNNAKA